MKLRSSIAYTRVMEAVRRGMRSAIALFVLAASCIAGARAQVMESGPSPVLNLRVPGGSVIVRAWDLPEVSIDGPASLSLRTVPPAVVERRLPRRVTLWAQRIMTPDGPTVLPAEDFVLPPLPAGDHPGFLVRSDDGGGTTIISVPRETAVIIARIRQGMLRLDGLRGTTFVAHVGRGRIVLHDVAGTGFVQVERGPILATGSIFARLRARTAAGNLVFERCDAQQIEASSVLGSVLYDDGRFEPGLARFTSQYGNVVLGVAHGNGATIAAQGSEDRLFTSFAQGTPVERRDGDVRATVGGGGPVVTASSRFGQVLLYDGSLRDHPRLAQRVPLAARFLRMPARRPLAPTRPPPLRRRAPPPPARLRRLRL
jgi:hypothetical protein